MNSSRLPTHTYNIPLISTFLQIPSVSNFKSFSRSQFLKQNIPSSTLINSWIETIFRVEGKWLWRIKVKLNNKEKCSVFFQTQIPISNLVQWPFNVKNLYERSLFLSSGAHVLCRYFSGAVKEKKNSGKRTCLSTCRPFGTVSKLFGTFS